jgi:hypothetical protein
LIGGLAIRRGSARRGRPGLPGDLFAPRAEFVHRYSIIDIPCKTILSIFLRNSRRKTTYTDYSDYDDAGPAANIAGAENCKVPFAARNLFRYLVFFRQTE